MSEGQELQQQVRGQVMQAAQDFYGDSLSRLKGLLRSSREQLQGFAEQAPADAQAQLQEMIDSYLEIEGAVDQSAQDQGIEDLVNRAADEAQEAAGQTAGQLGGLEENLAPGTWLLGEPTTDGQGQTVQRVVDGEGNIVETTFDGGGEVVEESLTGSVSRSAGCRRPRDDHRRAGIHHDRGRRRVRRPGPAATRRGGKRPRSPGLYRRRL